MTMIAIWNAKGGVGKTSLAVNLAWCASQTSSRRTVLWDLDPQGGATQLLQLEARTPDEALAFVTRRADADHCLLASAYDRLMLLPADRSLRDLDRYLIETGKRKRLGNLGQSLLGDKDRLIIDCPAGMGVSVKNILRTADIVVIPTLPTPLSMSSFAQSEEFVRDAVSGKVRVIPLFNMVDPRRPLHRKTMETQPKWPRVPMSRSMESMAIRQAPLGVFAPGSPVQAAIADLWKTIERTIAKG